MSVTLLCVGSLKFSWAKDACEQYLLRLGPRFMMKELTASKAKDARKQQQEECEAILYELTKVKGQVWVLDERGTSLTSQDFAKKLADLKDRGESVTFVLGGAYGLTDELRDRADKLFALGPMTLPHELCRVVILEQIYRSDQIQKGSGYHH